MKKYDDCQLCDCDGQVASFVFDGDYENSRFIDCPLCAMRSCLEVAEAQRDALQQKYNTLYAEHVSELHGSMLLKRELDVARRWASAWKRSAKIYMRQSGHYEKRNNKSLEDLDKQRYGRRRALLALREARSVIRATIRLFSPLLEE